MHRLITIINIPALAFMLLPGPTAAIERPPIGTPDYNAGCVITASYEDGSAVAQCADNVTYHFDPDGEPVSGRAIGWYVVE